MAKRGNPNPKGAKPEKLMRDALMIALKRQVKSANGQKTIQVTRIAEKMVEMAADGDSTLIKEIFDRVDGKVAQAVTGKDGRDLFALLASADLAKLDATQLAQFETILARLNADISGA